MKYFQIDFKHTLNIVTFLSQKRKGYFDEISDSLAPGRGGGGGGNAIYVPYGDVPPIRVYFLAFESETRCLYSGPALKQGAKFVQSLQARVPIHCTVWHPPVGFNLLSFVPEINPSFDVFNIFIAII